MEENVTVKEGVNSPSNENNIENENINEIEKLKSEIKELKNENLRQLADLENYKKRINKDRDRFVHNNKQNLIKDFIIVLDDLETSTKYLDDEALNGIQNIMEKFNKTLSKHGVETVNNDFFDTNFHESASMIDSDEEPNKIIEVLRKGYTLNDNLIRPSLVIISK